MTKSTQQRDDEYWEIYSSLLFSWMRSKATLTRGLLLRRSEVLRSSRHYLRAQSQGHHTINRLERRGMERGSARQSSFPWMDERGPSSMRQTLELFQRQCWGNFWETGWSAYRLFWANGYHLELNKLKTKRDGKKEEDFITNLRVGWVGGGGGGESQASNNSFRQEDFHTFTMTNSNFCRPKHSPQTANLKVRHPANYASITNLRSPATQKHKQVENRLLPWNALSSIQLSKFCKRV